MPPARASSGLAGRKSLAVDQDRAAVVAHSAGQYLDEGALSGAILAKQRMNLAGTGGEFGFAQRDDAAIAFRQAGDGNEVHEVLCAWTATRCLPAMISPGGNSNPPDHFVPAASAAVISTQSGVIGSVRPGAWSGKAFTPTSIVCILVPGKSLLSNGVVVTKSPSISTERFSGRLPVSRISTASLIASDER